MSSATSTSQTAPAVRLKPESTPDAIDDAGFRPWHFFVLASLIAATTAVVMSRGSTPEHLILISFTIGAAGAAGAGFYRMLVPLAAKEDQPSVASSSDRARVAMEREKMLVLRSIKELEFDRAMGKVSAKDFDEMANRLRARALMLMKHVDEESAGYRDLIERELTARIATNAAARKLGANAALQISSAPGSADLPAGPRPDSASRRVDTGPGSADLRVGRCASCQTANDPDASFCKRCGGRLSESPS